jgi:hypothetical protein
LEINEIVSLLRPNAAAGHDTIPMWAVKNSIDLIISKLLCEILNLSIENGIIPDQ